MLWAHGDSVSQRRSPASHVSDAVDDDAVAVYPAQVGNLELDQLFLEREKLNAGIALALDEATRPWGIRVFRYEIADIHVDRGTREAMEKQSNAERLRRAEVLESEGYRQRLINQSEGDRQSAINAAEGEAEAIRLRATAEAHAIKMMAEAHAVSTRIHAEATADGLRAVGHAIDQPGGRDAVTQRIAEKYVGELAESEWSGSTTPRERTQPTSHVPCPINVPCPMSHVPLMSHDPP